MWRSINWEVMRSELFRKQRDISLAAYQREWDRVRLLQNEMVNSFYAKVMAVRAVANMNSGPGVDGVLWTSAEEMMRAAFSLVLRGYRPLPYLHREIADTKDNGERRVVHVPTVRDRAM